eukprot:TRINITY_DN20318_c0_g2_i1.p1 TRINITY_DN20318_c0_g2~~TRINITY_DN20318_c0_g2_i1.p1  ORF type:complete len:517 (+),score=194.77 TRINITY_DN20318_c0_g2_i1:167-1717(+)
MKELNVGILAFEHGSSYCFAVSVTTVTGVTIRERSTVSLMIDTTGPILNEPVVQNILKGDILRVDGGTGAICFNLSWDSPVDSESGILQQINVVCNDEHCTDIVLESESLHTSTISRVWCSSDLSSGREYWIGIRSINKAHIQSFSTIPFILDSSAPVITNAKIGFWNDVSDRIYTSDQGSLSAYWFIDEPECDLSIVEVSIWKLIKDGEEIVVDWVDVSLLDYVTLDITMESGIEYIYKIRATNIAGFTGETTTNSIMFDSTPPIDNAKSFICVNRLTETLPDSLKPECTCICCLDDMTTVDSPDAYSQCPLSYVPNTSESLILKWNGRIDTESDIESFHTMLGTSIESDQISRWIVLPLNGDDYSVIGGVSTLAVDRSHTFTLRATNKAGLTSLDYSNTILVDASTPDCSDNALNEALIVSAFYEQEDFSQLNLVIEWNECEDLQSGLAGVIIQNNVDNSDITIFKTSVDPSHHETVLDVTASDHKHELVYDIDVWNMAGAKTTLEAKLLVDKT